MSAIAPGRGATSLLRHPGVWVGAYAALWFVVGLLPIMATDLDLFFWPSAKTALAGHPLMVYAPEGHDAYPNANGPLALVPLTAVGAVVQALGWLEDMHLRRAVAQAAFSLFIVLMAVEAVAAIEKLRGERLGRIARPLTYGGLVLAPPVWQSLLGYGHIEQGMEVWFVLVAVRWLNKGWMGRAGIAFALAVLARSSAAFLFIPLLVATWRRGTIGAARLTVFGAVTGLAGLLPFYFADPADVTHSLVTFRANLLIGAGSIWNLTRGTSLEAVGQHSDILFVVASAVTANAWLATRRGGFTEERLFAGLALTSASFVLLAKTVWPYYFMEAFVFATVWAVGRWKKGDNLLSVFLPPVIICGLGLIAEIGSDQTAPARVVAVEAGAMFVMLSAWMLWVARAAARPDGLTRQSAPGDTQASPRPGGPSTPRRTS